MLYRKYLFLISFFGSNIILSFSQKTELNVSLFEGAVLSGYVDNGAYLNFTGPNLSVSKKTSKLLIGMLPSLRFRRDNSFPKNAFITPSLGIGITYMYKTIAFQIPFYYTSKTSSINGYWKIGVGLGIRINALNLKEK